MSQSASSAAAPRRRWLLFLPFALVVLLAAAWTAVWFYAAARAETEIAVWRARERQAGRAQDCAAQSIGGYPFRIEVRCGGASFELKGTPTLQLKLPLAVAAVQVYDPKLLIGEFSGPLEISELGRPPAGIVSWTLAQASVRGLPAGVERASLALVEPTVRDPSTAANGTVFRARRLELHGRQAAGSTAGNPLVEIALQLEAAVADKLHPLAAKPIDADIVAIVRGVNDISPKPWATRFREWQARDAQIEITKARLAQEDVIAVGTGVLKLTPRGGLDGDLKVTVVGIEKVLKMFDIERIMSEGQIGATFNALDRLMPGLGGSRAKARLPAWSRRSASAPSSRASRRWRFRCALWTVRFSLGRFRWA